MNTGELSCILERALAHSKCEFLGVFAADRIPKRITTFPACFVINTDPSYKPGEHWVACYCATPKTVEFFDSYGFPPQSYEYIQLPITPTVFNKVSFQSVRSAACGHYCIYYLCCRASSRSFSMIVQWLKRSNNSDRFVRLFTSRLVRKLQVVRRCFRNCRGMQCCRVRGKK
ncbi:MAG: ADP-dependent glucokinase [Rhodocyclaceae bacterium]|jgi:hypothetical protein|nr:MAG: ADP-dependent glucokinase [Rhodocyclaceae bacterium]